MESKGHVNEFSSVPAVAGSINLPSTEVRPIVTPVEPDVTMRDYLDVLVRRKWAVITTILVCFVSALLLSLAATPKFTARAKLQFSPREANVTKFEDVLSNQLQIREYMQTQVKLLESKTLIQRVIDRLNLVNNPAVSPTQGARSGRLREFVKRGKALLFRRSAAEEFKESEETLKQLLARKEVHKAFTRNLSVEPQRDTTIINISYTSSNPYVARDVTNALVTEFVTWQMDGKVDAAKSAKQQLEKQLETARIQLERAENNLNAFAEQAGIVSLDSRLNLIYRQLEETNNALSVAHSERMAKESSYRQAVDTPADSIPEVINNKVIQELRKQYVETQAEYEQLKATYKDEYPKVKILTAKMGEIQNKIAQEQQRILRSLESEYLASVKKEENLRRSAEEMKAQAIALNNKAVQYKILQREVETNKEIYQSLLERSKEIDAKVGSEISNIRVVDYADLPLEPSSPKVLLNLLLALVAGLVGGVLLAYFREYMDNTIQRIEDLTERYQCPVLGVVPRVSTESMSPECRLESMVNTDPRSPFAEAIRTVKVSLQLSNSSDEQPLRTILVTSTNAGEGKSTMACNLALAFAAEERVLLIDADMRRPRLHEVFPDSTGQGLSRYLSGLCELKDIINTTSHNRLYFVDAGPIPPNPADMLASGRMRKLLERCGKHFDRIIIDAPPFAGFSDVLVLGNQADGVVFLTTLGVTSRDAVRILRTSMTSVRAHVLGTIVNKFDLRHSPYGYGKYYNYYHKYYKDYSKGDSRKNGNGQWHQIEDVDTWKENNTATI